MADKGARFKRARQSAVSLMRKSAADQSMPSWMFSTA